MRLIHLCALVVAAALSIGVAGLTLWHGYATRTELSAALLVVGLLVWSLAGIWRGSRPVAIDADEAIYGLRPMSDGDRALLRRSEADLPEPERRGNYPAVQVQP